MLGKATVCFMSERSVKCKLPLARSLLTWGRGSNGPISFYLCIPPCLVFTFHSSSVVAGMKSGSKTTCYTDFLIVISFWETEVLTGRNYRAVIILFPNM